MSYYTIPSGLPWSRFATNNAEASRWPNVQALWEWQGRIGSVSRCRWCAATATFLLAVHVCSVCKGEGGETEGLVPIILRARPVRWVYPRPCTACSAGAGLICYPNAGSH